MADSNKTENYRLKTGTRLGYTSIFINLFLFVLKLVLGLASKSISIISDAFHTLSDTITSLLVVISFKISAKPSDPEHPFGHGRAEQITAIVMATLLGVTAYELVKSSVNRLLDPSEVNATFTIAAIMLATVFVKEGLARFTFKYSKELNSDTLSADAWHHRSDAISTILVVISIIFARFGFFFMDGLVGILVGFYILYTAYIIVKKPIDHIMGTPTPPGITGDIKKIGKTVNEINDLHDIIYHDYGSIRLVSLHIEVDENMTLQQAHCIAEEMTVKIKNELNLFATVHVDPMSPKTEMHRKIENLVSGYCREHDLCHAFHELRLKGEKEVEIEDRKDKRIKLEGTQQSQMIDQRQNDLLPINFEEQDGAAMMPNV